jgi:hypothetical protein
MRQLVERAAEGHPADAEVLGERAFRREPRAGRPPSALDLLGEGLLDALVAELQPIEGVLGFGVRRHGAMIDR